MEHGPSESMPEQPEVEFRPLQNEAGPRAALFSDLGHAAQEHTQHSVRDEFVESLPFPFGQRATDRGASTQAAMEAFGQAEEERVLADPDHLEFYNESAAEDTSGRPVSPGNVTPDIRPFSSGPSV